MMRPKSLSRVPRLSVILPLHNEKATFSTLTKMLLEKQIPNVELEIILPVNYRARSFAQGMKIAIFQ